MKNESSIIFSNNNSILEIVESIELTTQYDANCNDNIINVNNSNEDFEDNNDTNNNIIISHEDKQILKPIPEIIFINKSIFDENWFIEADVAYAASLLFTSSMMNELLQQVLKMKKGSFFITLKELILNENEKLLIQLKSDSFFKMSWQMARVFIYLII